MEEVMQDNNNNGIPDQFEYQEANDITDFKPQENAFDNAYENEEQIKSAIPDYKDYQWYKEPNEGYFFSLGQKLEDMVEDNPEASKEILDKIVDEDNGVSKEDVKPLLDEINQINDDNPNNDEINNEKVEEFIKNPKIGRFLSDILDYISKEDYDKMPIDDIADADEKAMEGEGPTLTVEDSIDPDNRYSLEDSLNDFAEERFSVNWPQKKETLGDRTFEYTGKEIPEDEKEEEIKSKKLDENPGNMEVGEIKSNIDNPDIPIQPVSGVDNNTQEEVLSSGGISTTYPKFSRGSSSSSSSNSSVSFDTNINEKTGDNETNAGKSKPNKVEVEEESNAFESKSTNEALDDTFEKIGFMNEEPHKDIKVEKAADLPNEEFYYKDEERFDLKDLIKNSKGKNTLPFKFTFDGDDIIVSQIGTARREPLDIFLKHEPLAAKRIIEVLNQSNK